MRITYLLSKSNSLTRCQVRERLVSTDKSMRTECPLLMMPELMHLSMLRMRTILSIGSRIPYNKYILNTHNLVISSSSSSSSKCKDSPRMIWLKSKGGLKRYSITIPPLEIGWMYKIWNHQSFIRWCKTLWFSLSNLAAWRRKRLT